MASSSVPATSGFAAVLGTAVALVLVLGVPSGRAPAPARVESALAHPARDAQAARNAVLESRSRTAPVLGELERGIDRCLPAGRLAGGELSRFWDCAGIPIRQQVMRGRMEGMLLGQVLGDVPPGRCREMASALGRAQVSVSDAAYGAQRAVQAALSDPAPAAVRRAVLNLRGSVRAAQSLLVVRQWAACQRGPPRA